jgi:hypothetical protein
VPDCDQIATRELAECCPIPAAALAPGERPIAPCWARGLTWKDSPLSCGPGYQEAAGVRHADQFRAGIVQSRLGRAPVISLFIIVQVPNASDVRGGPIFLRLVDRLVLGRVKRSLYARASFLCRSNSVQPGTNKQSVAAIQLRNGTGVTVSGMCFSLGKSLPSLGHLNQKGLLPRINGCACVLQTPHSVSLAIFCDRHLLSPN